MNNEPPTNEEAIGQMHHPKNQKTIQKKQKHNTHKP